MILHLCFCVSPRKRRKRKLLISLLLRECLTLSLVWITGVSRIGYNITPNWEATRWFFKHDMQIFTTVELRIKKFMYIFYFYIFPRGKLSSRIIKKVSISFLIFLRKCPKLNLAWIIEVKQELGLKVREIGEQHGLARKL